MAAHATLLADDSAIEPLKAMGGMHACINSAPSAATWPLMVAGIKPRGRIVATAMVSQPVPISQEWFTGTGVAITGTSVGTRLEMRKLLRMHKENPLLMHINEIPLHDVEQALLDLAHGKTQGRSVAIACFQAGSIDRKPSRVRCRFRNGGWEFPARLCRRMITSH